MKLTEEWGILFKSNQTIYLYGAGDVAKFLIKKAVQDGVSDKIKGILVSNKDSSTPYSIDNIPVLEAKSADDKNAIVLIATSRKWSDEIRLCASELGFSDIRDVFKYLHVYDEATVLGDEAKEKLEFLKKEEKSLDVLKEKLRIMYGINQMFSNEGEFYQSLPLLGIEGERPTDLRIQTYGLEEIVEGKTIIDIGCNTGFLDITLASKAKSICGIEYNESLVNIANEVIEYLDLTNVLVCQGDFLTFHSEKKYEVVLLFAVHGWLGCSAEEGAKKIVDLLDQDGTVVFESQAWDKGDPLYSQYCYWFEKNGMRKIRSGKICDDGKTNREWCVYSFNPGQLPR